MTCQNCVIHHTKNKGQRQQGQAMTHYSQQRKIDPSRHKPDGSPLDNDRTEIGPTSRAFARWQEQGLEIPNLETMRRYRYQRVVDEINRRNIGGVLMFDPLNIRYASDSSNMHLWITHNAARACLVLADGAMILYDYTGCEHLSAHLPLISDIRPMRGFFYFSGGGESPERARDFAREVKAQMKAHSSGNFTLALDRTNPPGFAALDAEGILCANGEEVMEHAREIKHPEEIKAMRCAASACDHGLDRMRAAFKPGITENALWAELHAGNIELGGEWIETRLLSSGPRTNPWMQECGPREIQDGDLMAFDTDLVGCYGYCIDMSRTWLCGEGKPSAAQKNLYQIAYDHIMHNAGVLKPGMTFHELTRACKRLPEQYRQQQYSVMFHGVGLCDEYPSIKYLEDLESSGYEGVIKPGMTLCVEAYVGAVGGREGVKLEDQLLVTETGVEWLTHYPFEDDFLC